MNTICLKVLVLGDSGVGKTSLVRRYVKGEFSMDFITTMGVDFHMKTVKAKQPIKLTIYDVAGQRRFRKIVYQYFRGTNGTLIAFERGDAEGFAAIRQWLEMARSYASDVPVVLVETKSDVSQELSAVSQAEIDQLCAELGCQCVQTSAKSGDGVEQAFKLLIDLMLENLAKHGHATRDLLSNSGMDDVVILGSSSSAAKPSCCY